ncbi:hypothetical protein AB0G87_32295 [Streptomyces asoensis]|uniref:hypothetical protein n=1 Tax=Streptomyces asoensis TaxID=249586 RepID=UPI0033ECDD0B
MSAFRSAVLTPHLAGRDEELRLALEDLQIGRWLSTKALLVDTTTWALLTSRSQVLATGGAQSDAVDAWQAEEPGDAYALMMQARVRTLRALTAHRANEGNDVLRFVRGARAACDAAADRWPANPVPWVCLLALAQLDIDERSPQRAEHWATAPLHSLLPRGPWPLLSEVRRRDPGNREAHHRMLQCLQARGAGAVDFTRWLASQLKPGSSESVLLALPLYAYVEVFRLRRVGGQIAAGLRYWQDEQIHHYVALARDAWFAYLPDPTESSLLDLNHLAFALTACGLPGAADVFDAIGPFATPAPWRQMGEAGRYWQDDFVRARDYAAKGRLSRR